MTERPESHSHSRNARVSPLQRRLRRFRRNRFWLLLYLWVAALLPEGILRIATSGSIRAFFRSGLILGPLFSLVPALIVFILCTAIPMPGINFGICIGYSGALLLLHGVQLFHFQVFGTFYSVSAPFGAVDGSALWATMPWIIPMGAPFLFLVLFGRQFFSFRPLKSWKQHIPLVIGCLLIRLLTVGILPLFGGTGEGSPYGLYHHAPDMDAGVSRLGLLTACRLDMLHTLSGEASSDPVPPESIPPETVLPAQPAVPLSGVSEHSDLSPNILDLDFSELADREDQEAIAQIHRYFAGRTPSGKNEKTGIFSGCNLIQITASDFSCLTVSQELTPSLHEILRDGIVFTNYYLPEWNCSVTDREFFYLSGTVPTANRRNMEDSGDLFLPLTMVQQLIRREYSAWAICGSGFSPSLEALGYECTEFQDQFPRDVLDQAFGDCITNSPFTLYCLFEDSGGIQQLDQAITLLMTRLRASGKLENTVILLSSSLPDQEDGRGSCVIWKPGILPETVDAPAGPLDLLPTLSNLFGLEFDSRLYMGRDMFSSASPLVLFPDQSWITDRAVYDAKSGRLTDLTDTPVDEGYIETIRREVRNRLTFSSRILESNYWQMVFE